MGCGTRVQVSVRKGSVSVGVIPLAAQKCTWKCRKSGVAGAPGVEARGRGSVETI